MLALAGSRSTNSTETEQENQPFLLMETQQQKLDEIATIFLLLVRGISILSGFVFQTFENSEGFFKDR